MVEWNGDRGLEWTLIATRDTCDGHPGPSPLPQPSEYSLHKELQTDDAETRGGRVCKGSFRRGEEKQAKGEHI